MTVLDLLASGSPLNHVVDHSFLESDLPFSVPLIPDTFQWLSSHIIMQFLAAGLLILLLPRFARMRNTGNTVEDLTPRGFGNFFESICSYLRTEVARPLLGEHTDRFIPYIWSAFFYVLFCNLLGLLPLEALTRPLMRSFFGFEHGIGGAATGNIYVTFTLAACTLVMIVGNGLRIGGKDFIAHFCPGPLWLAPLLVPVELVGLVAKIFALTVRLFANMVAGHVLLAVLMGFIFMVGATSTAGGIGVGVVVILVSVAFNLLELFVAFLQAFIFTFLTTLFISQAIVFHHDDHGDEHGHAEAVAH